jgi:phospholipase/carboxylesterase
MLHVVRRIALDDVAYLVLEAAGRSWYPGRLWQPLELNEPWLSWSLEACEQAIANVTTAGMPLERILLGGFSQGACIAAEAVAQSPQRYGGVAILTGALMGPDIDSRPISGSLASVPVFLGSSERDEWIPPDSVRATARWFERAGADVTLHIDDAHEHEVDDAEVASVTQLLAGLSAAVNK